MNKDDIIKYGLMAAGGYLLYQWLSNNGYLAQFGIGPAAAQEQAQAAAASAAAIAAPVAVAQANSYPSVFVQPMVQAVSTPSPASTPVSTSAPAPSSSSPVQQPPPIDLSIQNDILSASSGDPAIINNMASGYVWRYYYNFLSGAPLTDAQRDQAFPNNALENNMTLSSFLGRVNATVGLSGIRRGVGALVRVPQVPQVPSMNFGGSGRPAFGGRRGGWVN